MKSAALLLALLLAQVACAAQGTIFFYNHVPAVSLDAPVFDTDGQSLLFGDRFQAQLYAGADANSLVPVGFAASFSLNAGYWNSWDDSLTRIIPGVDPGENAFCQVKVWSLLKGSTYDQVVAAGGKHGESIIFSALTGGAPGSDTQPPGFPGYLTGLESFQLTGVDPAVPEPGTVFLMAIGLIGAGYGSLKRRQHVRLR